MNSSKNNSISFPRGRAWVPRLKSWSHEVMSTVLGPSPTVRHVLCSVGALEIRRRLFREKEQTKFSRQKEWTKKQNLSGTELLKRSRKLDEYVFTNFCSYSLFIRQLLEYALFQKKECPKQGKSQDHGNEGPTGERREGNLEDGGEGKRQNDDNSALQIKTSLTWVS